MSLRRIAPGRAAVPVALVVLTFAVFGRVADHAFLLNWDDFDYVVRNEAVHALTWANVRSAFAGPYFNNYAPLHLLSYALDASLWGVDAGAFLLVNVALHAVNGVLLRRLLVRLGFGPVGAAFAAAVFLLHPVQVESVAWVSERKNVLAMTFSLAALHAFVTYRARSRRLAYVGALAATAAALLTKVIAVVVPPALLLLDACDPQRRGRRWVLDKVPFAIAAAAAIWATLRSQGTAIAAGQEAYWMDGPTTLYTMVPVAARYVGMVLWPAHLSAVYAPAIRATPDAAFWGSAVLLCAIAAGGAVLWRRDRPLVAWLAFFFVALLPVMHLVPLPTLMNDRYLYFPMLGAAALGGAALDRLATGGMARRRTAVAAACGVVALLGSASVVRAGVWRDDVTLWRDTSAKTPRSPFVWRQLGLSYAERGRTADAIAAYDRALALDPLDEQVLNNLGSLYNNLGRPERARPLLRRAVARAPAFFEAQVNLGIAEAKEGDLVGAERAFVAALAIRPDDGFARRALEDVRRALSR